MKYMLPILLVLAGVTGLLGSFFKLVDNKPVDGLGSFVMPVIVIVCAVLFSYLRRIIESKGDTIEAQERTIKNLVSMQSDTQHDKENLSRELSVMRERFMAEQNARAGAEHNSRTKTTIIRRLNDMLQEAGIDTTAANIPPTTNSERGLASASVARGNPVPPPPLPSHLRGQATAGRVSMASPNPPSAPVTDSTSNLLFGAAMVAAMSDESASARSESASSCSSRDSGYDSPSDSGGSYDSGGGGGSCD